MPCPQSEEPNSCGERTLPNKPVAQLQEEFEKIVRDLESSSDPGKRRMLLRELLRMIEEAEKRPFAVSSGDVTAFGNDGNIGE
jgi:hypothetical protein